MLKLKKLFKKLSYFDIALIGVIAILGITFVLFFYRKSTNITIRVKVTDQDVLYARTLPQNWYAQQFHIGDQERDALGKTIAEIISVDSFLVSSNETAVYLDIRVKSIYDSRTKTYSVRGKQISFGTPLRFNLSQVTFTGFVTGFPNLQNDANIQTDYVVVKAVGRAIVPFEREIEPAVFMSVKPGDKIFDSQKMLLADVQNLAIKPAQRITETDNGDVLLRADPYYKDIELTVKVLTKKYQGQYFMFDNLPLKIGAFLPLNFEHVSIFPVITDIQFPPEKNQ